MAQRVILGGERALRPRRERSTFLSPMSPQAAGEKLDLAIHGERRPFHTTLTRTRGHFDGNVQAPYFWVQSKASSFNPMARRVEGMLVPNAGSTEVRCELKMRPAATGSLLAAAGTLIAGTIVAVGIILAAGAIDSGLQSFIRSLVASVVLACWALFAGGVWVGRRLAQASEEQTMEFLTTVLDAPSIGVG